MSRSNWFEEGGTAYAEFRPDYPEALVTWLVAHAPGHDHAADIGCGTGQLTHAIGPFFHHVDGFDMSADQIAHAAQGANITYRVAGADAIPLEDYTIDLLTVAQAAHWFDLPAFYREAQRVLKPRGLLALISYGVLHIEAPLTERFASFYWNEIGPYWPKERKLVDDGYRTLDFPFNELNAPPFTIRVQWTLDAFLGYVGTWSATKKALKNGQQALLAEFGQEISALWGNPSTKRTVEWPIAIRAARLP
jgi:SAM-dependent methyltransferase